jgi:hypothetical protein
MYNLIFLSSSTIFFLIFIWVIQFAMFQASPPDLTPHLLREEDLVPLPPSYRSQAVVWANPIFPGESPYFPSPRASNNSREWGSRPSPGTRDNPLLVPDEGTSPEDPIDLTQGSESPESAGLFEDSSMEVLTSDLEKLDLD